MIGTLSRIWILGFLVIFSCSQEEKNDIDFAFQLETISFELGSSAFSSQTSFFLNVDYERNVLLVLNPYLYSIDTLDFNTSSYKLGNEIDRDGPSAIIGINSFLNYYDSIAFYMGSNSFYIDSKSEGLSSKKFSQVEGVEGSLQRITQGSEFGNCLRCADNEQVLLFNSIEKQGDYYFLQAEKLGQINDELIDFGLSGEFASNKIEFAISAKNKVVKGPVSYIQKIGNRYLVSWDFQSSIQFLNFSGENELAIAFNSDFFPNRKGFSPRDQRITDHQDFTAKSTEWNNDVSFGPIYRVPESENYFRLVKGKTSHRSKLDGGIFIVIFDSEFNFLAEKLINADTPEMGLEYFVLKSGIYIKRVTDSEDLLRYYRLIF